MSWHLDPDLLERYATGRADLALTMSVEAHLGACADCRAAVGERVPADRREAGWDRVMCAVETTASARAGRWADRFGLRETQRRLVRMSATLTVPWVVGISICLLIAVAESAFLDGTATAFVLLAPVLPVIGAAAAYGPALNPSYEISVAAPVDSFKLALWRVGVTLVSTASITALFGIFVSGSSGDPTNWLLPSIALTVGQLALSTAISPGLASGVVLLLWVCTVVATRLASAPALLTTSAAMAVYACLAVLFGALLFARRRAFQKGVEAWLATRYRLTA